jgi:hypothetical protein
MKLYTVLQAGSRERRRRSQSLTTAARDALRPVKWGKAQPGRTLFFVIERTPSGLTNF